MDAVKFITGMRQLCQNNNNCEDCVLGPFCCKGLHERTEIDAEVAVKIVEKWMEDHPAKHD